MNRRKFLIGSSLASSAAFVLPHFSIAKEKNPNSKINVACIGVGGIGEMTFNGMGKDEVNIVAVSDTDSSYSARNKRKYAPDAPMFEDYRAMLDKMGKDIDAVTISTPDHSHFKIAMDCMEFGKHVAVQKPLTHDVWQARTLKKAAKYYKVQTQMMNQGHATNAIRLIKEWYDSGVCGDVKEVHVMCGGPNWSSVYFKKPAKFPVEAEKVPPHINWDLWLNQGKQTEYNHIYTPLSWRSFWDYGTGMLGDWFCHTGDAPVWCLDLKDPVSIELIEADNNYDSKVFIPNSSIVKWTFPATDKRGEVAMYWYDGGKLPKTMPHDWPEGKKLSLNDVGMMMVGSKHTIATGVRPNFNPRILDDKFFGEFKRNQPAKTIKRVRKDNLYFEWFDAIKGNISETAASFDYSSQLTEVALLGSLAQRLGGKIEWDGKNMRSTNRPEAAQYVRETPRKGWEVKYKG